MVKAPLLTQNVEVGGVVIVLLDMLQLHASLTITLAVSLQPCALVHTM